MLISRTIARQPAVSLRSIAEELDVSVSLVSKVLSGRLGTSGANAQKVEAIRLKAKELNYRKNTLAAALRSGQQSVLGVCIHRHGEAGSTIVDDMVFGITDEANRHQQRLTIHYYNSAEEFRALCGGLHRNAMDGLIVGGLAHPELLPDLHTIEDAGVPIVTIYNDERAPAFPNIGMDQFEVGRQATEHLIEQGCRRPVHFRTMDPSSAAHDRHRGVRAAMAEGGLKDDPDLSLRVPGYSYEDATRAVHKLMASGAAFDGVVAQSDQQAAASLNVLVAAGRKVPDDVRIIGVDNSPFCLYASVPLTSVSQEFVLRGRKAVQVLLRKLKGEPASSLAIEPVIHVRASSFLAKEIL